MLWLAKALLLIGCFASSANGARILLISVGNASHFLEMDGVGRPLVDRGHKVYVLKDELLTIKSDRYAIVNYKHQDTVSLHLTEKMQMKMLEESVAGTNPSVVLKLIKSLCTNMLSDTELFPKLADLKLDLVIVDNFLASCLFLIPYKLGVPYVASGSIAPAFYLRLPVLPSVVEPMIGLDSFGVNFCEETPNQWGVVRRLCRLMSHVMQELFIRKAETEYLREYVDFSSIAEIRENASLTLVNQTPLLASPLPKLPHVEYVGGITTGPAKPLPKELSEWMDAAGSVVVASFGSRFETLPDHMAQKLFTAFSQLKKHRFLLRYKKAEDSQVQIPENVKTLSWLPQNDVLGHKSTRLFITHSGNNGQLEALYHAVPMLCFYIHADQKNNAKRVVRKGYGKMMNIHEYTVEELVGNLKELLENSSYSESIKKASEIFHSEKHPGQRAADAIEHVLKFGGDHLRPKEAYKLTWWQFYMLDLFTILYCVAVFSIWVSFKLFKCSLRCFVRKCFRKSDNKPKTD